MNPKTLVTTVLLAFVVASVAYLLWQESGNTSPDAATASATTEAADLATPGAPPQVQAGTQTGHEAIPDRLVVFYFHGTKRCNTCRAIQENSRDSIDTGFPEALLEGRLEFREVDLDAPGNQHYATDFNVTGSSLVLAEYRGGRPARFKNLPKVWQLFANKDAFAAYVQDETRAWLEEGR